MHLEIDVHSCKCVIVIVQMHIFALIVASACDPRMMIVGTRPHDVRASDSIAHSVAYQPKLEEKRMTLEERRVCTFIAFNATLTTKLLKLARHDCRADSS